MSMYNVTVKKNYRFFKNFTEIYIYIYIWYTENIGEKKRQGEK